MTRSAIWTLYNLVLLFLFLVVWLGSNWTFIFIVLALISLTIYPDKFVLFFMKMNVVKKHQDFWLLHFPQGMNVLNARHCLYYPEGKKFIFVKEREEITLEESEQYYLLVYLLLRKIVSYFPMNFLRFLFIPISVLLYFYQISAKLILVPKDKFEYLPSLLLGQDILTVLRV